MQWIVGLGLVVVPAAVMVLSLAPWYERAGVGALAAQEAARTAAMAGSWAEGVRAARALVSDIGSDRCAEGPSCLDLTLSSSLPGVLDRGGTVTARVGVTLPGVVIPFLGSFGSFVHWVIVVESVDPYRSLR